MKQTIKTGARTAVAYVRTAHVQQSGADSNLERQKRICEARARLLGVPLQTVYVDAGVSGLAESRPGLDRLLADLSGGDIGYVITADVTRLARSTSLAASLMSKLRRLGVKCIVAK